MSGLWNILLRTDSLLNLFTFAMCSVRVKNFNLPLCEQGLQERRLFSRKVKEVRETNISVEEDKSRNYS